MDSELAEHPKCAKESPHKGIHREGQAPKAPAPLRRPKAASLVGAFFRALGLLGKLQTHQNPSKNNQNPSKSIKIH